jgi:hypothetical protein
MTATLDAKTVDAGTQAFDVGDIDPGHSPDLSKTGDMFERMVAFVRGRIKV